MDFMKAKTLLKKIFLIIFLSFSVGNVFSQDSIQNNITYSNYYSFYYNYENGVSNMLSIQDIVRLRYDENILFSFLFSASHVKSRVFLLNVTAAYYVPDNNYIIVDSSTPRVNMIRINAMIPVILYMTGLLISG